MTTRTTKAGGCFLTLGILGGVVAGLAIGNLMQGVLVGTAAGIGIALLTFVVDRRRG
jgi:hypothetical protein